jgi:photosystem II stability/assembly factor-like uncharacterized protein
MKRLIQIVVLFLLTANISLAQWVIQSSNTTNDLLDVFFINVNNGAACGLYSTILHTTDGGLTWIVQPNSLGRHLYAITFINNNTGIVVGDEVIGRTTDGGASWVNINPPADAYLRGITFVDANTGFMVGSNGSIFRSINSGANWVALGSGTTEFLKGVAFANNSFGFVTGNNGAIMKTTNGGDNWSFLSLIATYLFRPTVINIDTSYICGDAGIILKTINGGTNWLIQSSGVQASLNDIYFVNARTGSVTGSNNTIIRTTNGGLNWLQQDPGTSSIEYNGVHFTGITTGYAVGSGGTIIYTITGGFPYPPAPNLIAPFNGAQNVSITPLLTWDSSAATKSYEVQIATDTGYGLPVLDTLNLDRSQLQVPAGRLQNNILYYWRVKGSNIVGNGPWSVSFHFTTIVALPNPPTLITPVNNANNVSLTPFFDWDSTSSALYYHLLVSSDSTFTTSEVNVTSILVSYYNLVSPQLHGNTRYYWKVSTTNAAGTGNFSAVSRFTTITTIPDAPILVAPGNGSGNNPLNPTLDWRDDITVTTYQAQLATDSLFTGNNLIIDSTAFATSQLSVRNGLLINLARYFWRVRTTNILGTGPYSAPWNFFTGLTPPIAPALLAPHNGDTDISTIVTLDWNDVPFDSTYRIQISTDSTFATTVVNLSPLFQSQYTTQGGQLQNNTIYFWRVNATNSSGTGPYSSVWHFRTVISAPIAPPDLLSPANGATVQTLTPVLDWNDVFDATGYKIQVATDSLFISPAIDTNLTPSQVTVPPGKLNSNTGYFWRVRGRNIGGYGPWSETWHFNTGPIGITTISTIIPKEFKLYNNYPNPFNPSTKIRFDLPKASNVTIEVYDLLGRKLETLVQLSIPPGIYETQWNTTNEASGIYLYRILARASSTGSRQSDGQTGQSFIQTKKMVLIK